MAELRTEASLTAATHIVASVTIMPPAVSKTTSMGFEVAKTFMIHESDPVQNEVRQYELWIDGELQWIGMGDDRADALLQAIISATGEANEIPDD